MRLLRIKLAGFKSFVDPTTVLTPGQLVGIVGPNGCGKSNVIDAVRWVLGESRASALRGESMQDVIFNGSTTRPPGSRASVELVFDNSDGRIGGQWGQYAELSVKRVLDRAGNSDYLINQQSVRRKDVIDLFLGTGLGPRAYGIIEQGMISRVIEARPEEVRAFLEEAAGISKYRERRRETEGRLSDANDNLVRLEDIRAELGQRIERLQRQAEVAQRHKALADELAARQTLLWQLRHREAKREHAAASQALVAALAALDTHHGALQALEAAAERGREAHTQASEAVGSAQGDLYATSAELTRVENALRSLREQHARLSQRIAQLEAERGNWAQRSEALASERSRWQALRTAAEARLKEAEQALAAREQALPQAEQAHEAARQAQQAAQQHQHQLSQRSRAEEARLTACRRSLEGLAHRETRLRNELSALGAESVPDLAGAQAAEADAQRILAAAQAALDSAQRAQDAADAALQQARDAERGTHAEVTQLQARIAAMAALQEKLQDAGELGKWLREQGLNDAVPLWRRVRVQTGWELALEAILRERLAALPMATVAASRLLGSKPPATLVLHQAAPATESGAPGFAGLPPLAAQIDADDAGVRASLQGWLQGCLAVDNLTDWLARQTELPPGVTLVSRQGQLLTRDSLTLFAPDARTHGAVEREREIAAGEKQLGALRETLAGHLAALSAQQAACTTAQQNTQNARQALQASQQAAHQRQLARVTAEQTAQRLGEAHKRLLAEQDELNRLQTAERNTLSECEAGVAQIEQEIAAANARLASTQADVQTQQAALDAARNAREAAAHAAQEARFALRESDNRLEDIARNSELANDQSAQGQTALQSLRDELAGLDEKSLTLELEQVLTQRAAREQALAGRRAALDAAAAELRRLDEERLRIEHAQGPERERANDARLRQQAAELAAQQAAERLAELQREPADDNPQLDDCKEGSLTREVNRLTREIAELGAVNMAALEELREASERKGFLDAQYEDLMLAVGTLEDAIRRIDRETRELLGGTFRVVNQHFGELFPRLFGGGEAQLVLTGEEILDAGVQIVARPPGKKNSSIHLLSGGEKALTAIALVFAMFQLNPAPFCLLDEVDAPLDDANTERYCDMVRHMSVGTQFIFISHSKITMEMGRQLIGVTMQEQGVSRIVEVDIDEALKLAQPA